MATPPRVLPTVDRTALAKASSVASVATALPEFEISQAEAKRFAERWLTGEDPRLLEVFDHAGVATRRVCMPLAWYEAAHTFEEVCALYAEHALALAQDAARGVLAGAGLAPRDVDHVVFVSSTGIVSPTIDARLVHTLGLRDDVRRTPVWGLGCSGGVAGLALARDLALARPEARVLLVALELCSFAYHRQERDRRNLVAASLFGDGAAAAIVCGSAAGPGAGAAVTARVASAASGPVTQSLVPTSRPRLALVDSSSITWKDTLDIMGWNVDGLGLHVVISRDIPAIARTKLRPVIEDLLARHGLALEDVQHLAAHPGGPKVLDAIGQALGVGPGALRHARGVLSAHGNMSSPTCLFVLERALTAGDFRAGDWGLVFALGPGFSAEQVLLHAV
jgi:alkylresorcinol/alkylpyrone synthase